MKTKTFKIGEYAVGGIVTVSISKAGIIHIEFKDWNTKEVVEKASINGTIPNSRPQLLEYLNIYTSSYYADKIVEWIDSHNLTFKLGI